MPSPGLAADQKENSFIKRKYNKIKNKQLSANAFENHLKYLQASLMAIVSPSQSTNLSLLLSQFITACLCPISNNFYSHLKEEEKPIQRTIADARTHTHTHNPIVTNKRWRNGMEYMIVWVFRLLVCDAQHCNPTAEIPSDPAARRRASVVANGEAMFVP